MSDLEEKRIMDKLDSGNYVVVPKWKEYLRYISLAGVIILFMKVGAWTNDADTRMFDSQEQKESIVKHPSIENAHYSFKSMQEDFIPRREYEVTLKNIYDILKELKEKK